MKRLFINIIIILLMMGLSFTVLACSNDSVNTPEPELLTVTYTAMDGGNIEGEKNQMVEKGNDGNIVTAVPDDGYVFLYWSDSEVNPIRQEKNIQVEIYLTAFFRNEKYDLTFAVKYEAGEGGRIIGNGTQLINYGMTSQTVTATPNTGYDFIGWSDGVETAVRSDKEITQEINVTAQFKKKSYEVNYYESDGGKIEGSLNQTVAYGNSAETVTAVPDIGYKFVRWSDTKNTNPIRTDNNVSKSINATAEFDSVFSDGKGTENNPVLVETYEQFLDIKLYPNLYYKLINDLDLSGGNHTPLFSDENMFSGVFDGKGHRINNMTVNTYTAYPSLFGVIYSGTVKNLNIIDFEITVPNYNTSSSRLCVGAVAGVSWGILDNIYAKGEIKGNGLYYDGVAIGGLVGQAGNLIMNCRADVSIEVNDVVKSNSMSYSFNIGGLVGVGSANIILCETQGKISVTQTHSDVYIGGLVGYFMVDGTDILSANLAIKDCNTNIEIINGNDSFAYNGGLIASAVVYWGILKIENCAVYGDITTNGGGYIGGLICYIKGYGASEIKIINSFVNNNIIMRNGEMGAAAGFIFEITNNSDSGGTFEVSNCYSEGSVIAAMVGGFCYTVLTDVKFYRCYSSNNIQCQAISAGFIFQMIGGIVEECFTTGTIIATYQAAGFIFTTSGNGYILNCYSTRDVFLTNTDPDSAWRSYACGFILLAKVDIINCYSSGKISGYVYTTSEISGLGSIVGDFAGTVTNTQIINCHVLCYDDTFATNIIARIYTPEEYIDLTVYYDIAEMSSLTDMLNEGLDEPVWINGENGLPELKFVTSYSFKELY